MKNNRDEHIDQALKKAFAQIEHKAPEQLWSSIQESLDSHKLDQTIDKKVQESFASNSMQAPAMLWDVIDRQLPNALPSDDLHLDQKINEFYRAQEITPLPESVWKAVNRQLNIDRTWKSIAAKLDKKPLASHWRKKTLQFFAAASVLLLLAKNCTNDRNPIAVLSSTYKQQDAEPHINYKTTTGDNTSATFLELFQVEPIEAPLVTQNNRQHNGGQAEKSAVLSKNQVSTIDKNTLTRLSDLLPSPSKVVQKTSTIPTIIDPFELAFAPKNQAALVQAAEGDLEKLVVPNSSLTNRNEGLNILKGFNIRPLIQKKLSNHFFSMEPIQLLDLPVLSNVQPIVGRFQAGAFIVLNATMLLNNDTRSGFDEGSLVQNYYGMAANYGVWLSCRLHQKGALVAEFSVNADNRQAYGVYERGSYYLKEWVMKYNRVSLAYQHDFFVSKTHMKIPHKLVGQLGLYAGFLREAKLFYDGDLKFDGLEEHHRYDFGFKLALGQEIYLDRFVLGYGLRSDFGIVNIFKGNTNLNSNENNTNIIHLGGYLSIGYRF
jgi:hypothetical protein